MAHLAFLFVCVVWGTTFIFLERVTHAFGPVTIGIWRLFGGAAALGILWWLRQREFRLQRADWGKILFLALVFNSVPHVVLPYLLGNGFGHSFFGPMVAPIPLITVLVSIPMLGVWPTKRQFVGVLGGLACMWLIVEDGFGRGMGLGFLALAFIIPLTGAVGNTYIKRHLAHVPAVPLTAAFLVIAGLSLVPLEFFPSTLDSLHIGAPAKPEVSLLAILYLMILGIVGTGISSAVYVWMVHREGPLFAGMTTYVVPVLALAWGQFDGETITPYQMAAIAGILAMVTLVQFAPASSRKSREVAVETLQSAAEPVRITAEPALGPVVIPAPVLETAVLQADSSHQAA